MKISSQKLIGMRVETEAGRRIGRVEGFNLDISSQSILEYIIKPSNLAKGLVSKNLIISRGQVLEITERKMVVEETGIKSGCDFSKIPVREGVY